jgi:hypothetical protein
MFLLGNARKASAKSTCLFCDGTSARKSAEQSTTPGDRFVVSGYCAVYPPSTMMSWPVMNAAPGELSQSTALAISSGVPTRPTGVCVAIVGKRQGSGFADARGNSGNKNSLVFEDFHNWGPMAFLACQCLEQGLAFVLETGQIRRLADGAFGIG